MSVRLIIFIGLSLVLVWISRISLRNYRTHGFYRFFAIESILGLVLLVCGVWFEDPFSPRQLVSWSLLMVGTYVAGVGFWLLREIGKPGCERDEPTLIGFEKTTELVTTGVYRYIRHPLYSSLMFMTWGALLKQPDWTELALATTASAFLILTARTEERENLSFFGSAYEEYMKRTKMFIPGLF